MSSTTSTDPRILLMGCGAIGGVLAGRLLHAGYNVELVTRNASISHAIANEGLRLVTPNGVRTLPALNCADACPGVDGVEGPFDIILLAMKATDVEEAARDIAPLLTPDGIVVTLQNGIVEDHVAAILADARPLKPCSVIGALVGWGATMHAAGTYEMTSRGETTIGELDGTISERILQLKTVLDAVTPTVVTTNIYGALWSKLAINSVVTTLGAVTGQLLGPMLRRANIRRLALAIVSEVIDVATAQGVAMEPVAGTLDLQRLYQPPEKRMGHAGLSALPKHLLMGLVGIKFRKLKSSMLQSIERNRPPEIAFMNGYVVARGIDLGIATPTNAALTKLVQEIAAGERQIDSQNLNVLWS